jgi:hypothetical protein
MVLLMIIHCKVLMHTLMILDHDLWTSAEICGSVLMLQRLLHESMT